MIFTDCKYTKEKTNQFVGKERKVVVFFFFKKKKLYNQININYKQRNGDLNLIISKIIYLYKKSKKIINHLAQRFNFQFYFSN